MKCVFKGSGVAISTPMDSNGVNVPEFRRLIEWQIENGTDAIIALGTTGEPSTMTQAEKDAAIECAVSTAKGKVPVIIGTGGNNTAKVIEDSKHAQAMGADALLIVTPYYNKATQGGLIAHYTAVADAVDIPIIIYNVPARTGLNMTAATLAKLANHPNIWGMKEASGNITQIVDMCRLCADKIAIYSGNDDHILPLLPLGGMGVISVVANVAPKETHDLVAKYFAGDIEGSRNLQFDMTPLISALFIEVNPIPVKMALNLMGFNMGEPRLPLTTMTEANMAILKKAMTDFGIKIKG